MATEVRRAPRVVSDLTSMAAASAVALHPYHIAETDFVASWALLWEVCGGAIVSDGATTALYQPAPADADEAREMIGHVQLYLRDGAEVRGALKVLAAMVRIGGAPAMAAIAGYANVSREA